jgi:hypothetical protein
MRTHHDSNREEACQRPRPTPPAVQNRMVLAVGAVLILGACDLTGPDRVRLRVAGQVSYETAGPASGQQVVLYDYRGEGDLNSYVVLDTDRTDSNGDYALEADSRADYADCGGTAVTVADATDISSLLWNSKGSASVRCVSSRQDIDFVIPDRESP